MFSDPTLAEVEDVALPPPPLAASPKSHATLAIALVLAFVAGTLVLAAIRFNRPDLPSPQRVLRQVTFHSGLQRDPTWSPNGRSIAYASGRAGNSDTMWRCLATGLVSCSRPGPCARACGCFRSMPLKERSPAQVNL